ncbi:hypothetical protein [Acidiplasma sp.]|uniref:hypothetical protein n=1 Tax=Acidiplasma sp. TaxID=1872114 RepID=UPI0031667EAC
MNPEEILDDEISSATVIAGNIIKWFIEYKGNDYDLYLNKFRENYYGMGIIEYTCNYLSGYNGKISKIEYAGKLYDLIKKDTDSSVRFSAQIFNRKVSVATISYSSMVRDAIINNMDKIKQVYIMESGPAFEGISLYDNLSSHGIKTIITTDYSYYEIGKSADILLLGSDLVTVNGDLVHKNGTFPLALTMNYFNKPVYSLTTSEKISNNFNEVDFHRIKNHTKIKGFINRFFDYTYGTLITGYIYEYGFIRPNEIMNKLYK